MIKHLSRKILVGTYLLQFVILPASGDPLADKSSAPSLTSIRADNDEITLDLSQQMPYQMIPLSSPQRLVIEIQGTLYRAGAGKRNVNSELIKRVRGYQFKENPLITRVVIDLNAPVDYKANPNGNQVVISLTRSLASAEDADSDSKPAAKKEDKPISRKKDLLSSLPKESVTLDFEGADIRDVVRLMAETSNINIIFGPEVTGPISIHLKKVPFDEAFSTILNLKGLVASQLGTNILRVSTPELLVKERSKAIMYTKTLAINYLKADEMAKHITAVIASAGRKGTITVADQSNSLVLTDTEEGIAQAERLISQLDRKPRQVMIETRIVEINLDNGFDIGVQWEFSKKKTSGDTTTQIGQENGTSFLLPRNGTTVGAAGSDSRGTGVSLPGPNSTGISFGFINDTTILSATLASLITQSKAKILSAPKVVTINGQQASIEAVQDIRFQTSTVSNGVVTSDFRNVSAGIKLNVTPTINAEDRVTLKINPESSFPTQQSTSAGPIIQTRTAQTTVIIKEGETLVIGGLISDQDSKGVSKVPVLGDLPIIGVFFRSNTSRKTRNELLVFVTPRIVRD